VEKIKISALVVLDANVLASAVDGFNSRIGIMTLKLMGL
jgi:hypothetical protein